MRTEVPTHDSAPKRFMTNVFKRLRTNLRFVIITIFTIVFYAKLAIGANVTDVNPLLNYKLDHNKESQGWIGEKKGNSLILELDALEISDFEILLDDNPYVGVIQPNEEKVIQVYNLSELLTSSFYVHEFWVNDKKMEGKFENLVEWTDYLNKNTFITWSLDMSRGLLICNNERILFSDFIISRIIDSGKMKSFTAVSASITKNVLIEIPKGKHKVTINNFVTGDSETKELFIEKDLMFEGE